MTFCSFPANIIGTYNDQAYIRVLPQSCSDLDGTYTSETLPLARSKYAPARSILPNHVNPSVGADALALETINILQQPLPNTYNPFRSLAKLTFEQFSSRMASVDSSISARDDALARVSAGHLHQCLWLPETQDHPRLRVTFGTTSNFDDESLPAILFIPPMFGSRWFGLETDKLARDSGVRVVFPDRYCSRTAAPMQV